MLQYKVLRNNDLCEWHKESVGDAIGMIAGFYAGGSQKVAILIDPFVKGQCEILVIWQVQGEDLQFKYTITKE